MFEATLEAQSLHAGQRRLGTLSAAMLAHATLISIAVAVTAIIVPPVIVPPPPAAGPAIVPVDLRPPALEERPHTAAPLPRPRRSETPQPVTPPPAEVAPPQSTPDTLPAAPAQPETDSFGTGAVGTGGPDDGSGAEGLGDGRGSGGGSGDGEGADAGPVSITGDMVRPVLLSKVEPVYPIAARLARLQGRVTVEAVVGLDGRVESATAVSSTSPLFDAAAVDAVRQWRYRPALMDGRPVRVYFHVVVTFVIR